jgi:uncharacterized protein YutE (UPF0331/DUF86 family)
MELLNIILSFISSIAWPIIILIVFLLFKIEIGRLILRISNLKYKDLELSFSKDLQRAEDTANKLKLLTPNTKQIVSEEKTESSYERLIQLSEMSPEAAIMEAWKIVEITLFDYAKSSQLITYSPKSTADLILNLRRSGLISNDTYSLINELRIMRNKAVHHADVDISNKDVSKYIDLALSISANIKQLTSGDKS